MGIGHRMGRRSQRLWIALTVAVTAACLMATLHDGQAGAKSDVAGGAAARAESLSGSGGLDAVAALSAHDVWAVGRTSNGGGHTLVEQWNGTAWAHVPSPSAGSDAGLTGVAVTSPANAWAVGTAASGAIVLHWDGSAWTQMSVPAPGTNDVLGGVAATSATDAWAVGSYVVPGQTGSSTLILHWDGSAWSRVPSPGGNLEAVAASSPDNAWAVGATKTLRTLILHWNGHDWKRTPSPSRTPEGLADFLDGVAIGPGDSAWAVGDITCGCGPGTSLIEHYNGHAWGIVRAPRIGNLGTDLRSVVSVGARDAWAVGASGEGTSPEKTAILHWNGSAWRHVRSPNPTVSDGLAGLAVTGSQSLWAVGTASNRDGTHSRPLALRWTGLAVDGLAPKVTSKNGSSRSRHLPIYFFSSVSAIIKLPRQPVQGEVIRPASILLFNDGAWVLQNLRWTGWQSKVATAKGISSASNGKPDIADGKRLKTPASITLYRPGRFFGHEVYRCYKLHVRLPASQLHGCLEGNQGYWLLSR